MEALTRDLSEVLLAPQDPPCLSLYQPTHRRFPENRQDPIRFKNLCRELEDSLRERYPQQQLAALLSPVRSLVEDQAFWKHTLDGLAVLRSADVFRVYRLQRRVPQMAVVADTFHTKPLLRILQSVDRYQVLAIDRWEIKLFEGDREALDEIPLAAGVPRTITEALGEEITEPYLISSAHRGSAGGTPMFHGHGAKKDEVDIDAERFFRSVDRAVYKHHSSVSQLPLILAALPQHHALFRRVSHNPLLADGTVDVHPGALSLEALREQAWKVVEPQYRARIDAAVEQYNAARPKGLGTDELPHIARAVVEGRVDTLLVDADRHIAGRIDENGQIDSGSLKSPDYGDLLDDLAELALKRGSRAMILPENRMPTQSGAAAIYRY